MSDHNEPCGCDESEQLQAELDELKHAEEHNAAMREEEK